MITPRQFKTRSLRANARRYMLEYIQNYNPIINGCDSAPGGWV